MGKHWNWPHRHRQQVWWRQTAHIKGPQSAQQMETTLALLVQDICVVCPVQFTWTPRYLYSSMISMSKSWMFTGAVWGAYLLKSITTSFVLLALMHRWWWVSCHSDRPVWRYATLPVLTKIYRNFLLNNLSIVWNIEICLASFCQDSPQMLCAKFCANRWNCLRGIWKSRFATFHKFVQGKWWAMHVWSQKKLSSL